MYPSFAVAALSILLIGDLAATTTTLPSNSRLIRRVPLPSIESTKPLVVTSNVAPLSRVKASNSTLYLSAERYTGYGKAGLRDLFVEIEWAVKVKFGGEDVLLILDTGSSDTWVAKQGFQCVSKKLANLTQGSCMFGPLFNGSFPDGAIKNENFNITYADGEFLTGHMGYQNITVGGIYVDKQEVAIVNKAHWNGDGYTSGLIGVAYSALTMAYKGNDPTIDTWNNTGSADGDELPYSPVMTTMINNNLIGSPLFSLALQRSIGESDNSQGGYIAFGGLPPVSFDPVFTSTPILIYEFNGYPALQKTIRGFYTVKPDAYVYKGKAGAMTNHNTSINAIVDSGTTLLYVPSPVASAYLASFDPPAKLSSGNYFYPCNGTAPYFGVKIAGTVFNISSADIILPNSGYTNKTSGVQFCLIGVIDGGSGAEALPIFGDVFLKTVIAVFDIGASMMRFAQHNY